MMRRVLPILAVLLTSCLATAGTPELMERAVLPYTSDLPTCACTVPLREGDQLIVGLANGEIVSFHESGGNVIPRTTMLPGRGPVDDVVACRVNRSGGSANEFALLAVRGSDLVSIGFGDMIVAGSVSLPRPAGTYRFAKSTRSQHAGEGGYVTRGADHPVLFDDDSVMSISVETRTLLPRVETAVDDTPGLVVTALSDRVTVVAGSRTVEFRAEGGISTQIDESTDLDAEGMRVAVAQVPHGGRTLDLKMSDPDSVWVSRSVTAPGAISAYVSIADSLIAMGGTRPLTEVHDVGWVALVNPAGKIIAVSDHASPVTNIAGVSDFIAVQGDGRNLSIYDMDLNPLWDHDSPASDVVLLAGHFAGGEAEDLAVVGTRNFSVLSADVDSIRAYLAMPEFAAGATLTDGRYEHQRSFVTLCVSNEDKLRRTLLDVSREATDAFAAGEIDEAVELSTTARGAAAVLGEHDELGRLSTQIGEFSSFQVRRRSLLLAALVLAALGVWVAIECTRRSTSTGPGPVAAGVAAALLLAAGAWTWKLIGDTGMNPSLFAGGAVAALFVVRTQVATKRKRPVAGVAVEKFIRALMEFLHGAGEGVPSDGVVDAARKSVTKVAYLAQEMVDSMDDDERYEMLRERLKSRGGDFLDTTHPRVAVVVSLAKQAKFVVAEAEQMSRAAERMRTAIITAMSDTPPKLPVLRQQLQAIKEGRDQLATAADRAWAIIQTNPGCSLTRSIDRILEEKTEELMEVGVRVRRTRGVPPERDAVALWSFELRFILENLVTNAIRAMRDSRERVVTIEAATDGTMCSIRFTDTGGGMDEATARGLFDAREEERDGGFGMSNSRLRLQEHGGNIVLERTALDEGTVFFLTIPHWAPNTGDIDV